ncbi:MAG: sulfate respiration complex hexadecaheme cytochrome HmcA [Desulfomonilaceae bacterium]
MNRRNSKIVLVMLTLGAFILIGGTRPIHSSMSPEKQDSKKAPNTSIVIAHKGKAAKLDRAPVVFDHDMHTKVLLKDNPGNCALCHITKEKDPSFGNSEVKVFKFPKTPVNMNNKTSIMYGYHNECISCHKKMRSQGKKSGPEIGMCGKCHNRKAKIPEISWQWKPIFNYKDHATHVATMDKLKDPATFNIAGTIPLVGEIKDANKNCSVCHHAYDEKLKKLYYKNNSENGCSACHKSVNEKDARSLANVSHAACIGCHMKVAEVLSKDPKALFRDGSSKLNDKKSGPIECKGCHGEHKPLDAKQIAALPRLDRGQKDVMDLTTPQKSEGSSSPESSPRMLVVPFNHKSHEVQAQFCNECHHHSLEKCSNCHTIAEESNRGGGISYERAFHMATANKSCVGCHHIALTSQKCYGCHQWRTSPLPQSSCPVCHRGPSQGKITEVPPITFNFSKDKFPEKITIKGLEKEFKPVDFPHAKIANKLNTISNENSLARTFHAKNGQLTICFGCHHRMESSGNQINKFPACVSCHNRPFESKNLGQLGLLGAYHRQCVGCHKAMNQKPTALECVKCHAEKKGVKLDQLIPPVEGGKIIGAPIPKGE